MIVYHGSNCEVAKPDLTFSRNNLDFGKGFYVTEIKEQAEKWARRFFFNKEMSILNIYELTFPENSIVKKFENYDYEWLNFIISCRLGNIEYLNFDFIIGGVANDRVYDTIELYFDKLIEKSEALRRLKYFKPNNQMCVVTEKAISGLVFLSSEEVNFAS